MFPQVKAQQKWYLASLALTDAYTDFILSRQAMQCAKTTLEFYGYTAGVFLKWVEQQGVTTPDQVDARLVRQYLAELTSKGKSDKTLHRPCARHKNTASVLVHREIHSRADYLCNAADGKETPTLFDRRAIGRSALRL